MATKQQTAPRQTRGATAQPAPANNLPASQDNGGGRQLSEMELEIKRKRMRLAEFGEFLVKRQQVFLECLPDEINPAKFISVIKTAMAAKPDLIDCTFDSLWNACVRAAQQGLLPDGKEGAIAPYGDMGGGARKEIATWMPMIEGYRKLARNAGILDWRVRIVHERDHFDFEEGDEPFLHHKRYFGAEDPGKIVGAYSIAKLQDGTISREVMTIRELEAIRSISKAKNGPWGSEVFRPEMYKKTVARRHFKVLPKSNYDHRLAEAFRHDDEQFGPTIDGAIVEERPTIAAASRSAAPPADRLAAFAGSDAGGGEAGGGIDGDIIDGKTGEVLQEAGGGTAGGGEGAKETSTTAKNDAKTGGNITSGPQGGQATSGKAETTGGAKGGQDGQKPASEASGEKAGEASSEAGGAQDGGGDAGGEASGDTLGEADEDEGDEAGDGFPGDTSLPAGDDPLAAKWDRGDEPATVEEYRHYLPYVLKANYRSKEDANAVGPFFNSEEQKVIRRKFNAQKGDLFAEFMNVAVAHRDALAKQSDG